MKTTRLHQVAARTNDLGASVAFYTDQLGATHISSFDPPGLAFFDLDGVRLLLEHGASPATLYLWVDDIDEAWADLVAKGVIFDQPPHAIHKDDDGLFGTAGETEWMAFFKDPGGNTLALATRK